MRDLVLASGGDDAMLWREDGPRGSRFRLLRGVGPGGRDFALRRPVDRGRGLHGIWFDPEPAPFVLEAIAESGADRVWIHAPERIGLVWLPAAKARGLDITYSLHDHSLACPRGQRIRPDLSRCATIDRRRCTACVLPVAKALFLGPDRGRALLDFVHPRGGLSHFAAFDEQLRGLLKAVDWFHAPSEDARTQFLQWWGGTEVFVRPHPMPEAESLREEVLRRRAEQKTLGADPAGLPRVGFLGTALCTKGILVFLEAARRHRSAFQAVLKGPVPRPPAGPPKKALDAAQALCEGVYAPKDLAEVLASLDLVVAPSLWSETFHYAAREARAAGLPVVASDLGALRELRAAPGGGTVHLVPPGDAEALGAAICGALNRRMKG